MKLSLAALFVAVVVFFLYGKVFPWLASNPKLSRLAVFEGAAEKVTVIEKTESVTVTEEDFIPRLINDTRNILVTIVSHSVAAAQSTIGSGFFVTNDGVIAARASQISPDPKATYAVYTMDGNKHDATLIGTDPYTEIALLRADGVNASTLPYVRAQEFDSGRKTLFLHRTYGSGGSASANLSLVQDFKSTQNLSLQALASSEKFEGMYDVASGDSGQDGAAAISMQGELIGMVVEQLRDNTMFTYILPNTAIESTLQNIGEDGKLRGRNVLGISYTSLTPELADMYGLATDQGAWLALDGNVSVSTVLYGSPASVAGIRSGDIITKVGDMDITPEMPLSRAEESLDPGSEVEFTVLRGEKTLNLPVKIPNEGSV